MESVNGTSMEWREQLRDIFLSLSKQDHEIKAFKVDGDECTTTTKPHWERQRGDW